MNDGTLLALLKTLSDSLCALQSTHEKTRRQDLGNSSSQEDITITPLSPPASSKPPMRRRVTGDLPVPPIIPSKPALISVNPKARQNGLLASTLQGATTPGVTLNAAEDEADSGLTCGGTQERLIRFCLSLRRTYTVQYILACT
jgi:hypothetical protein